MIPAYAPYDPTAATDSSIPHVASGADRRPPSTGTPGGGQHAADTHIDLKSKSVSIGNMSFRRVSHGTVLLTLNQLAVMSQNGIDIAEAIETVASHCDNARLAHSLRQIHEAVNSGQPFSSAVAAYGDFFPSTLAPMLAAAEATGQVPQTLANVCERLRGELQLRGTILGAMIYPVILIAASSVVMTALVMGVLPQFSKVFVSLGRPIPATTEFLLAVGDFSRQYWMLIFPAGIAVMTAMFLLRRHRLVLGPLNRFLMYGWMIRGAYRPLQAGRSFRTLAAMVEGGVPLLESVRLTRKTTKDVYWQQLLDAIEENLIDGSTASGVMSGVDFIPPEACQMMATAERTGRVAEVLESIGQFYEEEAGRRVKRLVVALEPAIILVMGIVVAGVVMSLLLPLLDVSSVGS